MSKKTNCSVYTYHGNDVPYSTFSCIDNGFLKGLNQCRKDPRYGLAYFMRFGYETTALSEESRIKVENINGDILFIGPQKDDCWPSDAAIDRMGKILKEKSFPNNVKTILYEDASHALGNWPMENIMFNLLVKLACPNERKFPQKCKNAREKSIKDIMTFLNEW